MISVASSRRLGFGEEAARLLIQDLISVPGRRRIISTDQLSAGFVLVPECNPHCKPLEYKKRLTGANFDPNVMREE